MPNVLKLFASGAALIAAPAAGASDFSGRSASMTITVTIPPFLAALTAQREGAVGLWTVTDDRNALMIRTPDSVVEGEAAEAAIYHGPAMLFDVLPDSRSGIEVRTGGVTSDNGLRRRAFTIAPVAAPGRSTASIVVSAL